jgi:hypothetical protein
MLWFSIALAISGAINVILLVLIFAKVKSERQSIQALVELSEKELLYVKKLMKSPIVKWDEIPNADRDTIARLTDLQWLEQFSDGSLIAGKSTRYLGMKAGVFWEQNDALFKESEK